MRIHAALSTLLGAGLLVACAHGTAPAAREAMSVSFTTGSTANASASADHDCAELALVPRVVDLPVNGTTVDGLTVALPAGTYAALEARVRPMMTTMMDMTIAAITMNAGAAGTSERS